MVIIALCGRAARAEPAAPAARLEVEWSGAADCDRATELRQRIASDLGPRSPGVQTRLDVVVDGEPARWRAVIRITGATELERTVVAAQCDALADAVALVTVVAIDPFVHTPEVAGLVHRDAVVPSAPSLPERAPESPSIVAPPVQPTPRRPARERPHAALRAELGTSAFALPGLGFVVGIAPLVDGGRWRVEVPVRWSLPRERDVDTGVSARLQLVAASPRACWVPGRGNSGPKGREGNFGVPLCAGLEAGAMIATGRGDGLARRRTAAERWLAATASVAVRWRVHPRFATWLAIEGVVPFGRPTFHVVRDGDVHQAGPAMLLVAIGGEVHFRRERPVKTIASSVRAAGRTKAGGATIARRVHGRRSARAR